MIETFDARWLALREGVDHRSRADVLLAPLRAAWTACGWQRVLDLGCGTGSNLRYLAPRLAAGGAGAVPQRWTLVDHDAELLAGIHAPAGVRVELVEGDIASDPVVAAAAQADLVTGSALLDLVSEAWMRRLVGACASAGSGALFALSYDGDVEWRDGAARPASSGDDHFVRDAVNAHQARDKGVGPALGPRAVGLAEQLFRTAGYRTWLAPSPWLLTRDDLELVRALVEGWRLAAREERPAEAARIDAWARDRLAAFERGEAALRVGHADLLALPPQAARTADDGARMDHQPPSDRDG